MPILNGDQIRDHILAGRLVLDPQRGEDGMPVVEPASYDMRAGTVLWKDKYSGEIKTLHYAPDDHNQTVVTLSPGQMMFVITQEELSTPWSICGTVYSRNSLQKQNILALNAGHVDPGYRGPILIRLINLGQVEWPLNLGQPVFTVVFHTVAAVDESRPQDVRSKGTTLIAAEMAAAQAFSNPLHDLYSDALRKHFAEHDQQLRKELSDEFFRKDRVNILAAEIGLALFALIVVALKVPWSSIAHWLTTTCAGH